MFDHELNLTTLPKGATYEETYALWLDVFQCAARCGPHMRVSNAPASWLPLLRALGVFFDGAVRRHFPQDKFVNSMVVGQWEGFDRTMLEVMCSMRPETIDALYKCDHEWDVRFGDPKLFEPHEREFIVTSNASFDRAEIKQFMARVSIYVPPKPNVVLVPCSADKPYPSSVHKAVLDIMPPYFYLANVTGALGIVPQALWDEMPHYDAGIPNHWRVYETVRAYFDRGEHQTVVSYSDFYHHVLNEALGYDEDINFISGFKRAPTPNQILDLTDPDRLEYLKNVLWR